MKAKVLRAFTVFTIFAVCLSVTAWAVTYMQGQTRQKTLQSENKNRKNLREIAQERDVEIVGDLESEAEYSNLPSLAKAANAIVLGRITENTTSFDGDDSIVTNYQIEVRRVLKDISLSTSLTNAQLGGPEYTLAPLTTPLTLVRPGGTVNVNGHQASMKVKRQESLSVGKDYILFLWWSPNFKAYYLAGGISGAILVEDGLCLKPLASAEAISRKYEGIDLETFIQDVLHN